MKRLVLLGLLGIMGWMPYQAAAQVNISVNIGSQPLWGPTGYDYVDYYYLPDIECYYHVPRRQFIYMEGSRWRFSASLPSRYRSYNLYNGYKVVVNSYRNYDHDRVYYSRYRNVRSQPIIRYSDDSRYYAVKGHPHGKSRGHDNWSGNDRRDNDRRDYDRGRYDNGHDRNRFDNKHDRKEYHKGGDRDSRRDRGNDRGHDRGNGRGRH